MGGVGIGGGHDAVSVFEVRHGGGYGAEDAGGLGEADGG